MTSGGSSSNTCAAFPSVAEFLHQITVSSRPLIPGADGSTTDTRLAIGNPAGDADSLISAIGSAYLDTVVRRKPTLPIISIPLDDLKSLRPETKYLLELAAVTALDQSSFVAVDDPEGLPDVALVTLVDHNRLTIDEKFYTSWQVETILDHHMDEGSHTETCSDSSEDRMVAFDENTSSALVASTCTLIVERWKQYASKESSSDSVVPIPPSLSILLLGVILLDSINLSAKAGKVTPRDQAAVETLNKETDWRSLHLPPEICIDDISGGIPDLTKLFDTLQNQKFRPEFWNGLTALQALKLDYKSFFVDGSTTTTTFGVSSVLQPMGEFLEKPNIWKSIADEYLPTAQLFCIMFMTVENDTPKRQILLTSLEESLVQSLVTYLEQEGSLQIQVVGQQPTKDAETGLYRLTMEQGNAKASRKQVVPILMDFLRKKDEQPQAKDEKGNLNSAL